MDTIVIRVSQPRMDQLIAALGREIRTAASQADQAALQETWSWLVHRYTMTWGLPQHLADIAHGAGGQPGQADNSAHDRLA